MTNDWHLPGGPRHTSLASLSLDPLDLLDPRLSALLSLITSLMPGHHPTLRPCTRSSRQGYSVGFTSASKELGGGRHLALKT